jgi:hypothetical protein
LFAEVERGLLLGNVGREKRVEEVKMFGLVKEEVEKVLGPPLVVKLKNVVPEPKGSRVLKVLREPKGSREPKGLRVRKGLLVPKGLREPKRLPPPKGLRDLNGFPPKAAKKLSKRLLASAVLNFH